MPVITYTYDYEHAKMTDSQGTIGWRGVLEGMILTEVLVIQQDYVETNSSAWTIEAWGKGLVIKLFKATHSQQLQANVQVHDLVTGIHSI